MDKNQQKEIKNLAINSDALDIHRSQADERIDTFEKELRKLINIHGMDNLFGIHDFILSGYLISCAKALSPTVDAEISLRNYKKM